MSKVEKLFNKLVMEKLITKANNKLISNIVQNQYNICKPFIEEMSINDFAAYTNGFNAGRHNFGEKAQLSILKNYIYNIEKLNSSGKYSQHLFKNRDGSFQFRNEKTIKKLKSFDAIRKNDKITDILILKTIDIGESSDSEGGGHQDNVVNELINLIQIVKDQKVNFDGVKVNFILIVDGRSSESVINKCKDEIGEAKNVLIFNTDQYIEYCNKE